MRLARGGAAREQGGQAASLGANGQTRVAGIEPCLFGSPRARAPPPNRGPPSPWSLGDREFRARNLTASNGREIERSVHSPRSPDRRSYGCANLEIGSAMFSQYAAECSPSGRHHADHDGVAQNSRRPGRRPVSERALRSCILTKWSRDLGLDGKPTVVLKRVARAGEEDQTVVETTPPPQVSAVFSDGGGQEDWSSPRLYFNPEQPRAPPDSASRPMPSNDHATPR
jgi:hypothetical protein